MEKIAILVDGAFYKKRAKSLFGEKTPKQRANELITYCMRHVGKENSLYRIFFYDCLPSDKSIFDPLMQKTINLKKTPLYTWNTQFFKELTSKRKVALRLGELLEGNAGYILKQEALKKLCRKEITVEDLEPKHLELELKQKGVDMRIGLDISSISFKKQATQIVLIAGDSDFVPAAKHARREGIDFILDPMWHPIKVSLQEHIDGLHSATPNPRSGQKDSLCIK